MCLFVTQEETKLSSLESQQNEAALNVCLIEA